MALFLYLLSFGVRLDLCYKATDVLPVCLGAFAVIWLLRQSGILLQFFTKHLLLCRVHCEIHLITPVLHGHSIVNLRDISVPLITLVVTDYRVKKGGNARV